MSATVPNKYLGSIADKIVFKVRNTNVILNFLLTWGHLLKPMKNSINSMVAEGLNFFFLNN